MPRTNAHTSPSTLSMRRTGRSRRWSTNFPAAASTKSGFEQFANEQADFAFNQQPDVPFPEEETIPLPPERPTEAIQNDEAVNAFNAQPSTEDFNAQEAYDAWQSFYAQPSAEDVVGQETADANQAFNAQYDAALPEPEKVPDLASLFPPPPDARTRGLQRCSCRPTSRPRVQRAVWTCRFRRRKRSPTPAPAAEGNNAKRPPRPRRKMCHFPRPSARNAKSNRSPNTHATARPCSASASADTATVGKYAAR